MMETFLLWFVLPSLVMLLGFLESYRFLDDSPPPASIRPDEWGIAILLSIVWPLGITVMLTVVVSQLWPLLIKEFWTRDKPQ